MSEDPGIIRPKTVPLSHSAKPQAEHPAATPRWLVPVGALVVGVLLYALFAVAPDFVTPVDVEPVTTSPTADPSVKGPAPAEEQLPPYQALQREQARQEAQDELGRFVELELHLRDTMQVGTWGQAGYDAAKEHALAGDEAFLRERFGPAIASYQAATRALAELIEEGERVYAEALAAGIEAINARDKKTADMQLAQAQLIKPGKTELTNAIRRAERLPEVVTLFRTARNQELTSLWDEAVATYEQIRVLDADTPGLVDAIANARYGRSQLNLQEYLSDGFIALDNQSFKSATAAFNRALAIEADNAVALGGLQQVAEQTVVVEIDRLEARASNFEAKEQWQEAASDYNAILALDSNIQFAKQGRTRAELQQQSFDTLSNIAASAERLSSDRLYQEAQQILERAKGLEPRGPQLARIVQEVDELLQLYGNPVPVVLHSDNATNVMLSSVGQLGKFSEKHLNLRPGAYTLIGSRDGCRDVRTNITVRPEMAPVDIRCEEVLQR